MRLKLRRYLTIILLLSATMLFILDFLHTLQSLEHSPRAPDKFNNIYSLELSDGWSYSHLPPPTPTPTKLSLFAYLRKRFYPGNFTWPFSGHVKAEPKRSHIWPSGIKETDDRILAQIEYKPAIVKAGNVTSLKSIYVITGMSDAKRGQQRFIDDDCSVNTCFLTDKADYAKTADAVLFQNAVVAPSFPKGPNQVWVMFFLESPLHTANLAGFNGLFNWTATYRTDSTIVTPYEKFVPFENQTKLHTKPLRNYAKGKTEIAAWFVSNCKTPNNRFGYVDELRKYITVDIYGGCGDKSCPRNQAKDCYAMLSKRYKFYLAFENSNCKDYITEKFFVNALSNNIVPVVMGARPEEYRRVAPPHSFIHVDDFNSPRELAMYLHKLHHDDHLYNQYFRWKGTGHYINTKFYCRLCALLHDDSTSTWYTDVHHWWAGQDVCVDTTPRNPWALWRKKHKSRRKTVKTPQTVTPAARSSSKPYLEKSQAVPKTTVFNLSLQKDADNQAHS